MSSREPDVSSSIGDSPDDHRIDNDDIRVGIKRNTESNQTTDRIHDDITRDYGEDAVVEVSEDLQSETPDGSRIIVVTWDSHVIPVDDVQTDYVHHDLTCITRRPPQRDGYVAIRYRYDDF
ncbi:hypothetical protein ACFPYI_13770 [Halomarina salina]|uniref:Uncharacterized protein n=1 Tax=Halomarina salina TaxID=1872699 RepID=A0ABD5RQ32_9EURY|nr:hypothetical protein [Halomarina salina]